MYVLSCLNCGMFRNVISIPLYVWYMWRIDNKADFDFDFGILHFSLPFCIVIFAVSGEPYISIYIIMV